VKRIQESIIIMVEKAGNKNRQRVDSIRQLMKERGIDAYIIRSDDFHGSEYVGDYFMCRRYVTGFDGSAGSVVITADEAVLWTDGRYFLQAEEQLKGTGIELYRQGVAGVPDIPAYLSEHVGNGGFIAYDGRTVSVSFRDMIMAAFKDRHVNIIDDIDLVGMIWDDRPAMSAEKLWLLPEKYSGMKTADKLAAVRLAMKEAGADVHLIASLDDIAWIYNIRGGDIRYNPVALAYTMIYKDKAVLYINRSIVDTEVAAVLADDNVELRDYDQVYSDLKEIRNDNVILMDKATVNVALISAIDKNTHIVYHDNPSKLLKAVKNPTETDNERKAHLLDGIALTKLIYWLKKNYGSDEFDRGEITEMSVAEKLLDYRKKGEGFIEESFAPIIASGAHGAIVHYEATEETDIPLCRDNFVLMDTGGQYLYGTTDVTRTVALGELTYEQKLNYTAVLKGHLALGAAKFKAGTTGVNLDHLARAPLHRLGLDYNHGTGHGVGYLLNVHEGPNAIRPREKNSSGTAFVPGMITSNEPGVYIAGEYGIRTENMILCRKAMETDMGEFYDFETLTLVPYDVSAILTEKLNSDERCLLNDYHRRVYLMLSPYLEDDEREWLREATAPV
jgi:Xaa-Pro aminopeptidase